MRNRAAGHRFYVVVSCMVLSLFLVMGQALAGEVPSTTLFPGRVIGTSVAEAATEAITPKPDRTVYKAEDLQKALDDGIANIMIGASIKGNFLVPRWVHSISGTGQNIVISPADEDKPVFDAETTASRRFNLRSTADTLEFYNMTVVCGRRPGIDFQSLLRSKT